MPAEAQLRSLAALATALGPARRVEEVVAVATEEVRRACHAGSVAIRRRADGEGRPGTGVAPDAPGVAESATIRVDGDAWGELVVTADGRNAFGPEDAVLLQSCADQVGLALGRARLLEHLNALAFRDPLTGLPNRRAMEDRLEQVLARGRGEDETVALVLCDLDNLKDLNDGGGHDAGDAALRRVAGVLAALSDDEPAATACRFGGDEFCILLERTDTERAAAFARAAVERLAGGEPAVRISCGVASTGVVAARARELLRAADAALYTAKRTGRGRVCVADADPEATWRRATPRTTARRAIRDAGLDVAQMIATGLEVLEGPLAARPVTDRLEGLASTLAALLEAAGVAVSVQPQGADHVRTAFTVDRRTGRSAREWTSGAGERYALADFPLTRRVLEERSRLLTHGDDPGGDPAEQELLREFGMLALLATAAGDGAATWLVELYGDAASHDFAPAQGAVQLLVAEAVSRARSPGPSPRRPPPADRR